MKLDVPVPEQSSSGDTNNKPRVTKEKQSHSRLKQLIQNLKLGHFSGLLHPFQTWTGESKDYATMTPKEAVKLARNSYGLNNYLEALKPSNFLKSLSSYRYRPSPINYKFL